jgi:hypothetical protein
LGRELDMITLEIEQKGKAFRKEKSPMARSGIGRHVHALFKYLHTGL